MFPEDFSDNNENLSHLNPLMAYKSTTYPDYMYPHEAMQQEDKAEFLKSMLKEVRNQMDNGNLSIIKINQVPKGSTILPCVWQMKRKHHIKTQRGIVVRAKYFGISHAWGHRFRTAVSKA